MINFRDLITNGVHFGHQTSRWNPKMAPYIWGHKNGVHIIDVSKTAHYLERAAKFLEQIAAEGKVILFVGTKKPAHKTIEETGKRIGMPYVSYRWVGGMLTNYPQVKKSVTRMLHLEDVLSKGDSFPYTKKERNTMSKMVDRLSKNVGGIRTLRWPVGALVVVDVKKESTAIKEATFAGIPVVAMVDTNCDPSAVSYVIPANDDSPKSIEFIINYLAEAVVAGKSKRAEAAQSVHLEVPEVEIEQVDVLVGVTDDEDEAKERTARAGKAAEEAAKARGAAASRPAARRPASSRPAPKK